MLINLMTELNCLKEDIENLSKFHQVEILKILKADSSCTLNENKNGIFVNMTNFNKSLIDDIKKYLTYVNTQEKQLNDIEDEKEILSTTYFNDMKDNKDNTSISVNASSTI